MNNDELMATITSLREQLDMMRRGKNTWLHKAQALRRELEETKDELFYYKNRSTESTDKEMEDLEEKIDFCLSRKGSATNEIKATVVNATYFDLSYELLNFLGFSNEAMFLQQKKKELLC